MGCGALLVLATAAELCLGEFTSIVGCSSLCGGRWSGAQATVCIYLYIYIYIYIYCITPLAWVEIQCFALTAYMLTCLHAYMRTRLHACAYMFARLYALICLDTTVFLHAYVLTCLLATPCCPTLTHHLASRSRPRAGTDWTVGVWGGFRVRALGQTPLLSNQSLPFICFANSLSRGKPPSSA